MDQALNRQLHALLNATKLLHQKPILVTSFTNGRCETSRDMTNYEAIELIQYLKKVQTQQQDTTAPQHKHISQQMPAITKKTDSQRANQMRRKIIALAHNMGGKNRKERKSDKYYNELAANELAVFVKMCDLMANIKYGILFNTSMYEAYKREFPKFKKKCYIKRFDIMYNYIEKLLNL